MTTSGPQSGIAGFFMRPIVSEIKSETDSIHSYKDFLTDSLNLAKPDSVFRFELQDIILPVEQTDSMSAPPEYNEPSIFSNSRGNQGRIDPIIMPATNYDWLTALFLVCLVIFTWIKYYNTRRINQLFKAIMGRHNVNQLVRDGNLPQERITPGLILIYLTSLSVIVHQYSLDAAYHEFRQYDPLLLFLVIFAGITVLWLVKILTIKSTGLIFRTKQDTSELILTNLIFNAGTGMMMLPFVITGYYTENHIFMKISVVILLIGMGLRFFRSLVVGFTAQTFSVLYLFLYLCTLEILPVLFLYRLVTYTG